MQPNVKWVSYIFYAYAALLLLAMCGIFVAAVIPLAAGADADEAVAAMVGPAIGACVLLLLTVAYGVIGWGLSQMKSWARIAAIVLAILGVCNFPIGTALMGYSLYTLFNKDVAAQFV